MQHLKVAIWEKCNNTDIFVPILIPNMAKWCLINAKQGLQIRILIFSISRNIDSTIWNNRVWSSSPTSTEADKAWPNSLRGVFRVYLKGWHGPNQGRPVSFLPKFETQHSHHHPKKMQNTKFRIFCLCPSRIFTSKPVNHYKRLGGGANFVSLKL